MARTDLFGRRGSKLFAKKESGTRNSKKIKIRKSQPENRKPDAEITACEIKKHAGNHSLLNYTIFSCRRPERENTVKYGIIGGGQGRAMERRLSPGP